MEIYYLDDDPDDRLLVREAVKEAIPGCKLHEFANSGEFMDILHNLDAFGKSALGIDLIMLDVRMPEKDGFQILRELKFHPRYKQIPVIMFTDDKTEESVNRAYGMGANAYIVKSKISRELKFFLRALEVLWEPVRGMRSEVLSRFEQEMTSLGMKPVHILMVEDDAEDAVMALELLQDNVLINECDRVSSVQELRDYLEGEGRFASRHSVVPPDLILTDLLMPAESGIECIQWLKDQQEYCNIPIIAVTGSKDPKLHEKALEAGVECVCQKPISYRELVDVLRVLGGMQLSIVKVPHASA